MTESDQEARLREALRAEREDLPEAVRSRLAESRREAIALLDDSEAGSGGWSLTDLFAPRGLAVAAVASVAAVALWISSSTLEDPAIPLISAPEVAVVQDLELLEELEFLAWLEEESQGAG
jgi:hypothetical protein